LLSFLGQMLKEAAVVGIFIIPALYGAFESLRERVKRLGKKAAGGEG